MQDHSKSMTAKGGLKSLGRAVLLAAVLGSTSLAALPAQAAGAQSNSSAHFSFSFSGNGFGFSVGNADRVHAKRYQPKRHARLSVKQVRRILARQGFRHIRATKIYKNSVVLVTKKRGRSYIVRVSRRDGHLISLRQVRKQRNVWQKGRPKGTYGWQHERYEGSYRWSQERTTYWRN